MLKDQKYQQVREKSVYGFHTFDQANTIRNTTRDALIKAKDKATKVKVRRRPDWTFDVVVYQPVPAKSEAKAEK